MSKKKLEQLRVTGYDFDFNDIFQRAWKMFLKQPVLSVAYTMLIISLQLMAVVYLDKFAFVFALFLAPPLYSGFYLAANRISLGLPVIYPDFFKGFSFYMPIFSIWLIGQILVALGLFAFLIPGIYLAVGYSFAVLMALFGGFDFWTALEESRKLITVRWWKFFVFTLILIIINLLGILTLGLGLLVTIPITFYATYILFEDLTKDIFSE
ncbi:hypothetical protein [Cognataquiflexum aquatile]|uniref:hypothetical protein n=1 Tax=Cognataquiflexum aquatile TaxID=2249427 RepID=UPI000DE8D835|nr:hypothetical protein [Cognataquiflexum aquatile]